MSVRYLTLSYTTALIAPGGVTTSGDTNKTVTSSLLNVVKIKVVPDTLTGTFSVKLFKAASLSASALLAYWRSVTPKLYYPEDISSGTPAEALEGYPIPYEDDDSTSKLHLQITNNDSASHTYAVTVEYELLSQTSFINAADYGAVGNGSHDDTAAIQAALDAAVVASNGSPAIVFFKTGNFKITSGLTLNANGVQLIGSSKINTILNGATADFTVLTISGRGNSVSQMSVQNLTVSDTGNTAALKLINAVEITISDCFLSGNWWPLYISTGCSDNVIYNCNISLPFGGAAIYLQGCGGTYIDRCKVDQSWPYGAAVTLTGAWVSTHGYSLGDVILINSGFGNYYLQCVQAGNSGSSEPTLAPYYTNIIDGTVRWQTAGQDVNVGLLIDGDTVYTLITNCDFTSRYRNGIKVAKATGAVAPQKTIIQRCEAGGCEEHGFFLETASGVIMRANTCSNNGAAGIKVAATALDVTLEQNLIYGSPDGVELLGGALVEGNLIGGASTAGINVAAGVTDFILLANKLGSVTWGACAKAIWVQTGASNRYSIQHNLMYDSTTGITDGGTGNERLVSNNWPAVPSQTLSGAGAVDVTSLVTNWTTTGANAGTLADGLYEGQEKFIVCVSDGGVGTLTPSNLWAFSHVVFTNVGDGAHLRFTSSKWLFIGGTATLT